MTSFWMQSDLFALQHCRDTDRRARRRALTFELRTRGNISFGKTCTSDSTTHACLTFEQIYKICRFDITNAIFSTLGQCVRQILGVPMGSPGSPAYAICLCMFSMNTNFISHSMIAHTSPDAAPPP